MSEPPPPEICGRLPRNAYDLRAKRKRWMQQAEETGMTRRRIAAALGANPSTVCHALGPLKWSPLYRPAKRPRRLGKFGDGCRWRDFTPQQRQQLYRLAARDGCETPAEWMTETIRDALAEEAEKGGMME